METNFVQKPITININQMAAQKDVDHIFSISYLSLESPLLS